MFVRKNVFFHREPVLWSRDILSPPTRLQLTLYTAPLPTPDNLYVDAKLQLCNNEHKTVAKLTCRATSETLHVVRLVNNCRRHLSLFESRQRFRHAAAWLLRRAIALLLPSRKLRNATQIRLIADGVFLNNQRQQCINNDRLVAYYKSIGLCVECKEPALTVMAAQAETCFRTIGLLFLRSNNDVFPCGGDVGAGL